MWYPLNCMLGALNNFTVIENATHLTLYWTEPQEAPSFINYIAVYEQADPSHAIRNDYVPPSELNLVQDEASKAYSISKAHLVEGGYFGPLLIHVRGQSGGASWNTEEVLYNPTETGIFIHVSIMHMHTYVLVGVSFNYGT